MNLPGKKYSVLLTDPPWAYSAWNAKQSRTSDAHYPTMTGKEIASIPVYDMLTENAAVFMWSTPPMFDAQVAVLREWGLRYVTVAFTWVKLSKKPLTLEKVIQARTKATDLAYYRGKPHGLHFGLGHYTRANTELCLLALKGKMPVDSKSVRQIIMAPIREHSRKPDEQWSRIDELYKPYSNCERLEMFARPSPDRPHYWDMWGNEVEDA